MNGSADAKSATTKRVRFRIVSMGDMTDTTILRDDDDGMYGYSSDSSAFLEEDSIMTPDHTAYYCARSSGFANTSKIASSPHVGSLGATTNSQGTFHPTVSPPIHLWSNHDTWLSGSNVLTPPKIPSHPSLSVTPSLPTVALQARPLPHRDCDFASAAESDGADDEMMWIDITK